VVDAIRGQDPDAAAHAVEELLAKAAADLRELIAERDREETA
jgi:DNA-binding FadR family transcriptional regulator